MNESNNTPATRRGRPKGSTAVKLDADKVATHQDILSELSEISPVSKEPIYNTQKKFTPAAYEATRTKMLIEIMETRPKGEVDQLLSDIRSKPTRYNPAWLESWLRGQKAMDEWIRISNDPEHWWQEIQGLQQQLKELQSAPNAASREGQSAIGKMQVGIEHAQERFAQRFPGVTL